MPKILVSHNLYLHKIQCSTNVESVDHHKIVFTQQLLLSRLFQELNNPLSPSPALRLQHCSHHCMLPTDCSLG